VWTTWTISYQAIRDRHKHTANLLLLWSFLDNKDLWYGFFATACAASDVAAAMLSAWIGDIASSEVRFNGAMQQLRNYSLVEEITERTSYTTHPVVHRWARHSQGKRFATELSRLSVIAVGWAVPGSSARDCSALQQQLLPHAQACSRQIVKEEAVWCLVVNGGNGEGIDKGEKQETVLDAIHFLGDLYRDQGKLDEAEQMYERALRGYEEALGPTHTSTLDTVSNLGLLYYKQGRLDEAEQMYERALRGYEAAIVSGLVQQYRPVLRTLENIGDLCVLQEEIVRAQAIYARALSGLISVLGRSSEKCMNLAAKVDFLRGKDNRSFRQ
jgi:tetratricopeptide (TPR) repeat protein